MANTRIVVTSIGAISPLGVGFDKLESGLPQGVAPTTVKDYEFHQFDEEVPVFTVKDFNAKELLGKKGLRTKDEATKVLMGAIELAGLTDFAETDPLTKPGLCMGTAFGSVQSIGDFLSDSLVNGVNAVNPMQFPNTVINSPTGNANIRYEVRSLSTTTATGFNAGIDALIYSCDQIRRGYHTMIVAGGVEEISYYATLGMLRSGVLSKGGVAKPFAINADGFVAGEGAVAFMLETQESAKARGATIIAEVAGYCSAFDPDSAISGGYGTTGETARYTMKAACEEAGISTSDISFVAASANGTPTGDAMEADAIVEVFGDTPVAAYKAKIGEAYGAGSALNVACAIADMNQHRITGVGSDYDTKEGLGLVKETKDQSSTSVVVNAFSCDGNCASLVLKKAG